MTGLQRWAVAAEATKGEVCLVGGPVGGPVRGPVGGPVVR
jgi:hypothetical protein